MRLRRQSEADLEAASLLSEGDAEPSPVARWSHRALAAVSYSPFVRVKTGKPSMRSDDDMGGLAGRNDAGSGTC